MPSEYLFVKIDPFASIAARLVKFFSADCQRRGRDQSHRIAYLRSDELQAGELSPCLLLDEVVYLGIDLCQWSVQSLVLWGMAKLDDETLYKHEDRTKSVGVAMLAIVRAKIKEERVGMDRWRRARRTEDISFFSFASANPESALTLKS